MRASCIQNFQDPLRRQIIQDLNFMIQTEAREEGNNHSDLIVLMYFALIFSLKLQIFVIKIFLVKLSLSH